jgi:hypothetical protein
MRAALWLNNGLPIALCEREPVLWDYGFYRRLDTGQTEFVPFCSAGAQRYFAVHEIDLGNLLDQTLPGASP